MIQSEFRECQRRQGIYNWTINLCKDFLQNLAIAAWIKVKCVGIIIAFTGFGKTVLATKIIKRYLAKNPNGRILIIVPSNQLHTQWTFATKEFGKNVAVYVINTYTMSVMNIDRTCGLLIVDEVHHAAGTDSKFYNTVFDITTYDLALGITATLDKQQKEYLHSKYNLDVAWEISLAEGKALNIIPKHLVCNIGVSLTQSEQATYVQNDRNYKFYLNKFSIANYEHAWSLANACLQTNKESKLKLGEGRYAAQSVMTGKQWCQWVVDRYIELKLEPPTPGKVYNWAAKFNENMAARNYIICRSIEKHRMMLFFFENIHKNIMVFTTSKKILDWWKSDKTVKYHSTLKKSEKDYALSHFCVDKNIMLTCGSLIEGYDNKKVEVGVRHDYNSTNKDQEQIVGRIIRVDEENPDKFPVNINLYCNTFKYMDPITKDWIEIVPQDQARLKASQINLVGVEQLTLNQLMARL